jgi:hypothetical protein
MIEPGTVTKRPYDSEQNFSSKHTKCDIDEQYDSSISESKCSDNEDSLRKHSKKLIKQFKYLYKHSKKRKFIDATQSIDENINQIKKLRWELRYSFNRNDLFKEGYAVLSDELFPFYSLCYMVTIFSSLNVKSIFILVWFNG